MQFHLYHSFKQKVRLVDYSLILKIKYW